MARRKPLSTAALRKLVEKRARRRCEYCHAPLPVCGYRFHVEHVIPRTFGGSDAPSNRALACASCNLAKGDRDTGIDSDTGEELPLFHPRRQQWHEHFRWTSDGTSLRGRTPTGRATIAALDMNSDLFEEARRLWFESGWLP